MVGKHVFLVPGYGTDDQAFGLKVHIRNTAESINEEHPDLVILSGGESQRASHRGETEAGVMFTMLQPLLTHHPHFILEEKALTSLDNILNSVSKIHGWVPSDDVAKTWITIPCEWNRRFKMLILASLALPEYRWRIKMKPSKWEYGFKPMLKQTASTLLEVAAFYCSPLAERFREFRKYRAARI